jgi:PTS system mannose-specific IIC component/fructoselysine and glucoselysine-specific PTS system IIC component
MVKAALLGVLCYWIFYWCETYLTSWQCLSRPIIVAPFMGLFLGDPLTGLKMGAELEAIFMGISGIGGSVPADGASAAIISVSYTIMTGSDMETGLALAMPVGTIVTNFGVFSGFMQPLWSALTPHWEKVAGSGDIKKFTRQNLLFSLLVEPIPSLLIIFFGIAYGITGIQSVFDSMPAWFMTGMNAAASMMVAVGFGILCSMIWDWKIAGYFFVGYVLAACLNLSSLAIAVIGISVVVLQFFNDKQFVDFRNEWKAAGATETSESASSDDEGGFF